MKHKITDEERERWAKWYRLDNCAYCEEGFIHWVVYGEDNVIDLPNSKQSWCSCPKAVSHPHYPQEGEKTIMPTRSQMEWRLDTYFFGRWKLFENNQTVPRELEDPGYSGDIPF